MTEHSHLRWDGHLVSGIGKMPVIQIDRLEAYPTNGDCFGLRPRNDIFMALHIVKRS